MAVVEVTNHLYNGTEVNDKKREFQLDYDLDTKPTLTELQTGSECFVLESGSYFLWQIDKWVEV